MRPVADRLVEQVHENGRNGRSLGVWIDRALGIDGLDYPPGQDRSQDDASWREVGPVAVLLLAVMLTTLLVGSGLTMFSRPLWLDEYHTILLAREPSVGALIRHLAQGSDFNPPLLYLLVRWLGHLTGGVHPVTLRILAFASTWIALTAVYAILRRSSGVMLSIVGSLLLWSHPLVLLHAFDGRFYGPLLMFAAVFALTVTSRAARRQRLTATLAVALSSIALCTIHYFGVFAWLLVSQVALHSQRQVGGSLVRAAVPLAAGPLALLLCTAIYLGQRQALSSTTWVPPVSEYQLLRFLSAIVLAPTLLAIVFALILRVVSEWRLGRAVEYSGAERRLDAGRLALLSLAGIPVILILFSILVQPALIARYAISALLILPAVFTIAARRASPLLIIVVGALVINASTSTLSWMHQRELSGSRRLARDAGVLTRLAANGHVMVSFDRHVYYPLTEHIPGIQRNLRFPEFDSATVHARFPTGERTSYRGDSIFVERDVARVHQALYGTPRLITIEVLRTLDRFYVIGSKAEEFVGTWFPGRTVESVSDGVLLSTRPKATNLLGAEPADTDARRARGSRAE